MLTVQKRNGRIEPLDISKIQKYTSSAIKGLDNVSQSELEVDAKIQFRDKITTEEIQKTLIKTAVDKIDIDRPNWTFVAARLFLYDLYHKVNGFTGYGSFADYLERGEKEGRIVLGLKDKYDLKDLENYLKPERDLQFTYLGIKTLHDRYLIKNKLGRPIELPQHMFMAIAMFLAQNELNSQDWAKKFYDVISKFEVMLATPTLSNARTPRHQLSSCYIGSTPDNIEGIFDSYKEMSLLSKFGGGIGWDWNLVRSMGGMIDGHKNAAGGIIPFLKITNDIAIAVDQLGTRKGAIAVYLEPWHMDVSDFLDLKKNSGEERRRAHDLFPALWINDLFMKRVEDNAIWTLFDPAEAGDLAEVYGEEFEKRYIAYEQNENISKEYVPAKELWKKILTSYFESGSPFLCFKDNANRANPNNHTG
ncbi:MAG: ribonucleotide reductase N-terminal alpha domain-containing protein, partial [Sulfurospirillaceae bacterium]|nr:ribonucleotide reductase N-terminal alpha domain-containing protein [Sulfurospirillaceae bacterium]